MHLLTSLYGRTGIVTVTLMSPSMSQISLTLTSWAITSLEILS